MKFTEIKNADEAKVRLARAMLYMTLAAGLAAFGMALYESWQDGMRTAIEKASWFALLILAIIGGTFGICLPGMKKRVDALWSAREQRDEEPTVEPDNS